MGIYKYETVIIKRFCASKIVRMKDVRIRKSSYLLHSTPLTTYNKNKNKTSKNTKENEEKKYFILDLKCLAKRSKIF